MATSELPAIRESRFNNKKGVLRVAVSVSLAVVLLSVVVYVYRKKMKRSHKKGPGSRVHTVDKDHTSASMGNLDEVPFYSLHKIAKATNNFNIDNKIGEGGFGPVYKGMLEDGQVIAVKRLSEASQQGLDEFQNEVLCIAKLQHRNLVKLLGYCIQGNEKMLIYEYMANKSLDSFLFDETRGSILDWCQRLHIIHGIARGILYLHQDSRLQIIHRDLKAGNILLDSEMNPKISDFGLARKFVGQDAMAKTKKVVGTLGYISPEYAVHGRFSIKSDVFSFGVIVLEIVSGKKNRGFSHEAHSDNLLGHAWRLYKEDKSIELMSASLRNSCVVSEVLRSIHVGLLCVQHHAEDRPTMLSVVLMLISEGALPQPKQPAFFTDESYREPDSVSSVDEYMLTIFSTHYSLLKNTTTGAKSPPFSFASHLYFAFCISRCSYASSIIAIIISDHHQLLLTSVAHTFTPSLTSVAHIFGFAPTSRSHLRCRSYQSLTPSVSLLSVAHTSGVAPL
ncbi:unnamed protein product [Lactuca saligna]|uniref:non-specific serine/threonine protein kinase n=1 Tax=Lactuca saligna TaxID=75948 RepID=A0AA35VYQ1_LACSI|nr:unnamed protein product [Lactuca saligna]